MSLASRLKATRLEYAFEDESGYRFVVVCEREPEFGWSATVTMTTSGYRTPESAINRLSDWAADFARQAKAAALTKGSR